MPRTRFLSDRNAKLSRGGYPATMADIITAQSEGAAAVHAGITPGHSPYVGDRSDRGQFLALMWFRGYTAEQQRIRRLHADAPVSPD